jgi:hypothetical protein
MTAWAASLSVITVPFAGFYGRRGEDELRTDATTLLHEFDAHMESLAGLRDLEVKMKW